MAGIDGKSVDNLIKKRRKREKNMAKCLYLKYKAYLCKPILTIGGILSEL